MQTTLEERLAFLEARMAFLENRIATLEARGMQYGPVTPPAPYQPPTVWPHQPSSPWDPPYTITCKLADGTTKDITFTSPIVAQTNS